MRAVSVAQVCVLACATFASARVEAQHCAVFAAGANVPVYVNWTSFETFGYPSGWKFIFATDVDTVARRWSELSAAKIHPYFAGVVTYTWATKPANFTGILIEMNDYGFQSAPGNYVTTSADQLCGGNKVVIRFHNREYFNSTPFTWQMAYASTAGSTLDLFEFLMHEMGHALGIWTHTTDINETMTPSFGLAKLRYGPTKQSADILQSIYGAEDRNDFAVHESTDNGLSWSALSGSNIDSYVGSAKMEPTGIYDGVKPVIAFADHAHSVCWVKGASGITFNYVGCWGTLKSAYGVGLGGEDNQYIMAWADRGVIEKDLRIVYTNDGATTWYWRNPPAGIRTLGTPGIWRAGANTWVVAYTRYTFNDDNQTGHIAVIISEDNGVTWTGPTILGTVRAIGSVSVTGEGTSVLISFTEGDTGTGHDNIRTIKATLDLAPYPPTITYVGGNTHTDARHQRLTLSKTSAKFIFATRAPDGSLRTKHMSPPPDVFWTDSLVYPSGKSVSSPAILADKDAATLRLFSLKR